MTPRTQAGQDLLAPYAGLSDEQVRAIEDEAAALDVEALIASLSEDDLLYDHPVAMSGEPMDPVLFVRWDAIVARLTEDRGIEATATPPAPPPHTRLILASENLLDIWGTRTERGERITVEWGEQKPEGWYEPVFTVHSDDVLATPPEPLDVERLARALHEWPKHTAGHHFDTCPYEQGYRKEAARVAAEYARLSAQEDAP